MAKTINHINGWIILDKPTGMTSAHAVAKVKRLLKPAKIGHAGTLDPLASGILPLALGEATKTVSYMMDAGKAYSFTVSWGEERDTDDREGRPTQTSTQRPSQAQIEAILGQFSGLIEQTPPNYSAILVDGKRAYDMARGGEEVFLKSRQVRVDSLVIASPLRGEADALAAGGGAALSASSLAGTPSLTLPPQGGGKKEQETSFICQCGKGTYIRSLGRDMGRLLGCYGHISALRRLKVGNFTEKEAISLAQLEEMVHKGHLGFLKPVESALDDILALDLTVDQATRMRHGQSVVLPQMADQPAVLARSEGKLVAIGEVRDSTLRTLRAFNL